MPVEPMTSDYCLFSFFVDFLLTGILINIAFNFSVPALNTG